MHILIGLLLATFLLPIPSRTLRPAIIRWWSAGILAGFNIQVSVFGDVPTQGLSGYMLVSNHISWIDVYAINSVIPVRFIAKLEIKSWPIFGYLVKRSGTIFINREVRKDSSRTVSIATEALIQRDNVCVFPEGTTTDGTHILTFKSNLIQAAINAQAPILPLRIHYPLPDGKANIQAAYTGGAVLIDSIKAFLNMRSPKVELYFLSPIQHEPSYTRKQLTQLAQQAILETGTPIPSSTVNA